MRAIPVEEQGGQDRGDVGERGESDRAEGFASDGAVEGDPEGDAEGAGEQAGGQVRDEERGDGLVRGGAESAQDGVVAGAVVGREHGGDDGVDHGEGDEEGCDGEPEGAHPVQVGDAGGAGDRVRVVEGQALLAEGLDAGAQCQAGDHQGYADGQPERVGDEPAGTAGGGVQSQPDRQRQGQPGERADQPASTVRWPAGAPQGLQRAAPHAAQRGPNRGHQHDRERHGEPRSPPVAT